MRTLVLGDVHGAARALEQVLVRAKFDPTSDQIIFMGDVCDGWSETPEAMDILMGIPNLIWLKGNHDEWTLTWLRAGWAQDIWLNQGGKATRDAFLARRRQDEWPKYALALHKAHWHYVDAQNRCFVHGGLGWGGRSVYDRRDMESLIWDREMLMKAKDGVGVDTYKEVWVGHTSTTYFGSTEPVNFMNVWDVDTGAGWEGKLTLMDIDTKEFWQSDVVKELYPDEYGRR